MATRVLLTGAVTVFMAATAIAAPVEDVVVSATREEARRYDLPESIGVLGESLIAEVRPTHPSELLERISGVHQVWLGGDHHTTVIRQPINFNPVYLYLENGVPTRSTGFFETNALFDVNIPQARRIEVTKGPGTALYGSDAIGGLVNVLTPLPSEDLMASVGLEASTRDYYRALLSAGGSSGKHGLRADLNFVKDDGWRDNTESERRLGTFTWTIAASDRVSIRNVLILADVEQDSSGSNLSREDYENNPTKNRTPISFRDVESVRFHSIIDVQMTDALLSITPYFRYHRINLLPFFALGFDPHSFETVGRSVGMQAKYRRDIADRFRLIVGIDIDYSWGGRIDQSLALEEVGDIFVSATPVAVVYDFDVNFLSLSPYVHLEWEITDRLRLVAGLRFDYAEYDYTNNLSTVIDPTNLHNRPGSQNVDFNRFTPKAGLTYDVTKDVNVFVSYRQGFRVPTMAQLFRPGRSTQSTNLDPVKTESFELGVRGRIGERIRFELTGYHMTNRDDILVFTNNDTGVRDIRNSGKTRHKGIELSVDIDIVPDVLIFSAAYAYNDHYFVEWMPTSAVDLSGNAINRAPKDIANVRLMWRPGFLRGGRVEIEYQHLGSYYLDDNNTRKYEGHDLIHVRASLRLGDQAEIYARLHNVFDERYATNGRFNAFAGEELKPGLPRTLFMGVSGTF